MHACILYKTHAVSLCGGIATVTACILDSISLGLNTTCKQLHVYIYMSVPFLITKSQFCWAIKTIIDNNGSQPPSDLHGNVCNICSIEQLSCTPYMTSESINFLNRKTVCNVHSVTVTFLLTNYCILWYSQYTVYSNHGHHLLLKTCS